jgi:hypothetical protein
MQTHFITLAILAAYAIASYLFASAWNRRMPSFDPNMDLGRKPFLNSRGVQVEAGTGALGMAMGGIDRTLENMTPGAAIAIAGIFAGAMAFMISTTMVPSWFFGVPGVTIFHKLLLYVIGLCWVWVACRSLAMGTYLLVSGKFIVVGLLVVPIWLIGAWIHPFPTSSWSSA